ncbi:type II toxin-antitoxin system RelE family toxin [Streptomyces sp. NRRL WC-3742]|uniref:type II toxin-antitoxin system RelE family toxin n=1 Tax=Streptomyces sp. NRRL WC-3742 TaxID=1463934 RepID=UPI0004CA4964|nr:type II toxin-antitoxin system RelE/ParE family toxin [Streptomyces sp. NRRL WC-3742]
MKYAFRFTANAKRQLRGISQADALKILAALARLGDDPYVDGPDVKKLVGHVGLYRLRIGVYRLAYEIHDDVLVIVVVKVGKRGGFYRDF